MKFASARSGRILAGAAFLAAPALAQDAQPQQQAVDSQAGAPTKPTDVKPIGDWTVRCFPVQGPSPCDMYEELQDKQSHQRVLGISIAYDPADNRNVAQIAVPLGVAIGDGVVIKTDAYASPKMPYRRCDRAGCYVELLLPDTVIADLAKSGPNATANVVADDGKNYALKFSLNGFTSAHDAMSALARERASKPGDAAAPAKKK